MRIFELGKITKTDTHSKTGRSNSEWAKATSFYHALYLLSNS